MIIESGRVIHVSPKRTQRLAVTAYGRILHWGEGVGLGLKVKFYCRIPSVRTPDLAFITIDIIINNKLILNHAASLKWCCCKTGKEGNKGLCPTFLSVLGTDGTAGNTSPKS